MSEPIRQDQEDFAARMTADPYFADISVLIQRKGVTESDIEFALGVLNEKLGKVGVCVVVLMPSLTPKNAEAPGPEYDVETVVQVIENAMFNLGATGTGKSCEEICERVRQLFHYFTSSDRSTYTFSSMEPLTRPEGEISYGVRFSRLTRDSEPEKVARPDIEPAGGDAPLEVTITCLTPGAAIYYTTDGSYPSSNSPTATLYAGPFTLNAAATVRAAAQLTGSDQSDVAEESFT